MSKPRWQDGRLDLGRMGELWVHPDPTSRSPRWWWAWIHNNGSEYNIKTEAAAQRAAERWLRAALKQAAKKLNDSTKE